MFSFGFLWGSKVLVRSFGVVQDDVDVYLWLPPVLFDLGAVAFGALAARYAHARGALRSARPVALIALACALSIAVGPLCDGPWQITVLIGVAMAGGGGLFAILVADMITRVGPAVAATAGGVTAAAQSLAYIVANPLIGRAVDHFQSYDVVFLALAGWMLPGAALWFFTDATAARS
jgi:MFS family permease